MMKICQHEKKIEALREAVENPGRVPSYHEHVLRKSREEWPSLWAAIDALLAPEGEAYLNRQKDRS